jgi:diadenosine tetraphosphatase ApaH/serine/threonine PP2A family protein phosphatase
VRALLYDVHGNLPALEAVLDDALGAGAQNFVLGGDYALFGAYPFETVERLHGLSPTWIRGNTDRWLADPSDAPENELVERSLLHCRGALGATVAAELGSLPATAAVDGALVCHASPRSDMLSFAPDPSPAEDDLLDPGDPALIVFGHTHLQFRREANGRLLVNPGSVGMPFDGDRRAAYALWRGGRRIELRRVDYDTAGYARDLRQRLGEALGTAVETLVRRVEQAAFVD